MEFFEPLSLHLSALAMGVPITSPQLERLIDTLPQSHNAVNQNTLLRVLLINERAYSKRQETSFFDTLGQLLKVLVSKVKLQEPLRSLASCNFDSYHKYCALSQDKQLQRVSQSSLGIFPVSILGDGMPRSIYHQKIQGVESGNPQWIFSRSTLKQYYLIKNAKMSEHVQQIYLFLLSHIGLLEKWKNECFKQFWGELYLYYNQIAFQPYVEETQLFWISWHKSNLYYLTTRLKTFELLLSNQEKLLYYLSLDVLARDQKIGFWLDYNPFKAAFLHFTKTAEESTQWQYLTALLYFHEVSQARGFPDISQACTERFKRLSRDHYALDRISPFINFFFSDEEVCMFALEKRLEYWRMPMTEERKKIIANYLLKNGVFYLKSLKYLEEETFVQNAFRSDILNQVEGGSHLIKILQMYQEEIAFYLKDFFPQFSTQEFLSDLQLFIKIWKSYYKFLQSYSLENADDALTERSYFHQSVQSIFYIPRQSKDLVFNLIIQIARNQAKREGTHDFPELVNFQQSSLQSFLEILSEQKRLEFEKERSKNRRKIDSTQDKLRDKL